MLKRLAGIIVALLALAAPALAQTPFVRVSATVTLAVTTAGTDRVAIGTSARIATLWVCNTGATDAYIYFGDSTVVAATDGTLLRSGICGNISPDGKTNLAAITASGSTTLVISPGSGTLTATGGGGGTSSASAGGGGYGFGTSFQSGGVFATLTATASSASVALPAGNAVVIQNAGTTTVSCTLGIGSATAVANEIIVPANSAVETPVGSNTFGACIDQTGSVSNLVVIVGGTDSIVNGTVALGPATPAASVPTINANDYPGAAVPISGNATGTTGAVVGTLAAAAAKTTYICGFNVQAIGGTATVGPITIAGLVGASQVYQTDVNSATVGKQVASANFGKCIPASAVNTAITITTTANGTATAVDVNSWGYQL